jgi:hypothetical protein
MTKSYLEGKIGSISYCLDFPYELEKRYEKMVKENREYAELIYDLLIEDGINMDNQLTDIKLKELISKHYEYIKSIDTL